MLEYIAGLVVVILLWGLLRPRGENGEMEPPRVQTAQPSPYRPEDIRF